MLDTGTLNVRKIRFRFDEDIAFQWNPGNPACGNLVNIMTFIAPAFERYFIRALRDAKRTIEDPALLQEIELFCQQEGQHAKAHFDHLALLINKYPGLATTRKQVIASYNQLFEDYDLKFHMAYMANLELLFAPLANFMVRNREIMFGDSDPRIASFVLWHLIEEFEHRSVAIRVYDQLFDDWRYRFKVEFRMLRHLWSEVGGIVRDGLLEHVPADHNSISHVATAAVLRGASGRLRFLLHCLDTLRPGHDPYGLTEPDWIGQWRQHENEGVDMSAYYPATPALEGNPGQ